MKYNIIILILLNSCKPNLNEPRISSKNKTQKNLGKLETKIIRGGRIWSLDWSPDGKFIACGNATGLLRIYRSDNLELVKILTGFTSTINGIDWSPDGKKIVGSGPYDDPRVIIWNLENQSQTIIEDHKGQVRSVQWSPKGTYFASTSHDGTIRIWTPEGGFVKKFEGADFGCVGIDWLNEATLAASCWDNTIRTYNISDNEGLVIENGNHRRKAVLSIDWHPNGKILATGDYGNPGDSLHTVKFWTNKGELITMMDSHQKEIRDLSWNNKGNLLATGGETIRLWNEKGELLKVFDTNKSPVWSLDWNPEGTRIASGHNDGKIRIWNTRGEQLNILDGHSAEINVSSFNKDSTLLAVGFSDGKLRFYDTDALSSQTFNVHNRGINHIAWSHSQQHLAVSSNDGSGSIWDVKENKLSNLRKIPKQKELMNTIIWNRNDTELATGSYNSEILVWDINGNFKYSVSTDQERVMSILWKNHKPVANPVEPVEIDYPVKVHLRMNQNKLELVPLNNNRFALIDTLGNLIKGDKKDFIRLKENEEGFVKIEEAI